MSEVAPAAWGPASPRTLEGFLLALLPFSRPARALRLLALLLTERQSLDGFDRRPTPWVHHGSAIPFE
eukprot:11026447-Alexandrium_andersonii.AAC.1